MSSSSVVTPIRAGSRRLAFFPERLEAMKIFGICGRNGAGRGDLVSELVARLRMEGLRVSIVKRAPPAFDVDTAGTDSWNQRQAGCREMIIASDRRAVIFDEFEPDSASPDLGSLIARLRPCDIVLAINFRDAPVPRIEVWDGSSGAEPPRRNAEFVVANATPRRTGSATWIALDDYDSMAALILSSAGRAVGTAPGAGTNAVSRSVR